MNATVVKFGYPETLVFQTDHWLVLLRPQAVTLGSLVLASRHDATAFGALPPGAHADLGTAVTRIEAALRTFVAYEKINFLMLMMVDPHVHFHVIPRYEGVRSFAGIDFPDRGWPGAPDLASAQALDTDVRTRIIAALGTCGPFR